MFDMLLGLLYDLSRVPGLGFLAKYHGELLDKRALIDQTMGDLHARKDHTIKGAQSVKDAAAKGVKGSKKRG